MALKEQMFDFEVFPNWWCCVIGRYPQDDNVVESIKDDFIVVSSDDSDARENLLSILSNPEYVAMGYNIKKYDNIILNGIASYFSPRQLRILNDILIDPEKQYSTKEHSRIAPFVNRRYTNFVYQDMLDDNTGSLKEKEACMQLDIRESTVPFDKEDLTDEEKLDVIGYCKHDVWASMMFYKVILKPFVATKLLVGKTFNIPESVCYKSTNANLAARALNARRVSMPDADKMTIDIPKELKQYITYSLPANVTNRLCLSPEKFDAQLFENDVSYSNGGIHSVPIKPNHPKLKKKDASWFLHVKSSDGWSLINVDAGSFYPNLMVNWNGLSRSIPRPADFVSMIKRRLDLKSVIGPFEDKYGKHQENAPRDEYENYINAKEASQAYKLILNTTFGASGNKYLELYDPYMTTYTCRIGQLLLTALANNLYTTIGKKNIKIIQTNTDGILIYIRDEYKDTMYEIGKQWEDITHIPLEFENEYQIWQRDVNNYVMGKQNGKVKTKGGFFVTDMQQPGYNRVRPLDRYVCREALIEYIAHGEDILSHIYNESDLSKFIISCHKGNGSGILREYNDGRPDEMLHKCNRAYASLDKTLGEIKILRYDRKKDAIPGSFAKYKSPGCPPHCGLINDDLSKHSINDYRDDIDYMWYVQETLDMLASPWFELKGENLEEMNIEYKI